jgi:hypothetical protein
LDNPGFFHLCLRKDMQSRAVWLPEQSVSANPPAIRRRAEHCHVPGGVLGAIEKGKNHG